MDERNSENDCTGVLQYGERLAAFVDETTDLLNYELYYKYFSTAVQKQRSTSWAIPPYLFSINQYLNVRTN